MYMYLERKREREGERERKRERDKSQRESEGKTCTAWTCRRDSGADSACGGRRQRTMRVVSFF